MTGATVETIYNKIGKLKPKVTFITKDADRKKQETALKLDAFFLKIFKKARAWSKSGKSFKSACVTGLGVVKPYIEKSKVKIKKVPVFNFFCDEAYSGEGTCMSQPCCEIVYRL